MTGLLFCCYIALLLVSFYGIALFARARPSRVRALASMLILLGMLVGRQQLEMFTEVPSRLSQFTLLFGAGLALFCAIQYLRVNEAAERE